MTAKITESQHSAIQISCWMLDRLLCQFEQWAMQHAYHSVLYGETNHLTKNQGSRMRKEIEVIRMLINKLKIDLELKEHHESVEKIIRAASILFVTDNLMTLRGTALDAYGKTDSELTTYLDPIVAELINRLNTIAEIASEAIEVK